MPGFPENTPTDSMFHEHLEALRWPEGSQSVKNKKQRKRKKKFCAHLNYIGFSNFSTTKANPVIMSNK